MPSKSKPAEPDLAALETEVVRGDPRTLTLLEKNARTMPEREFKQMVENIRRDGALLGAVLTHVRDGKEVVLSGNHRTKASIAAGLAEITWIRILSPIDDARAVGIQLSQNALVGRDDQNILRELYESLDVLDQKYSGLTDTDLGLLDDPDFEKLRIGPPKYEEVVLAFLPEDREEFQTELESLTKRTKAKRIYMARYADYEAFFQTMLRTKDVRDVTNDAVSIAVMIELAKERLDQLGAEGDADAA